MTCCARPLRAITRPGRGPGPVPWRHYVGLSMGGAHPPDAQSRQPGQVSRVGGGSCRGCGRLPAGSRITRPRSACGSGTPARPLPTPRSPTPPKAPTPRPGEAPAAVAPGALHDPGERAARAAGPGAVAPFGGAAAGRRDPGRDHGGGLGGGRGRPPGGVDPAAARTGRGPEPGHPQRGHRPRRVLPGRALQAAGPRPGRSSPSTTACRSGCGSPATGAGCCWARPTPSAARPPTARPRPGSAASSRPTTPRSTS